ncbi:NAD(P)-dependent alcohol dehydrogenase [Erythrobacter sp. W53]|uniref:NAD(P)-dependent alcohol dehydrogenase n=1 Tax=Erythrobacter sp. W53 TaxID=3425947 RepID=UPI003D7698A5
MPRSIQAAVCEGNGAAPQIETLYLDDPAPDELVIEVAAAGICHTDLGIAEWSQEPRVFGHEGAGTVVEIGAEVSGFSVGDRVVATFGYCGECAVCNSGRPAYCVDGIALNIEGQRAFDRPALTRPDASIIGGAFFQQSCFATHALVTERNVVKIPDSLDFIDAAPLGCGIQTGAGAVFNQLDIRAGQPIAIIGCGTVGLSAIMAAKIIGCDPIISVDLDKGRLELARDFGATDVLDGAIDPLSDAIREMAGGGAAAILDAAGTQRTFEQSLHALRPGGTLGTLTLPGAFEEPVQHPGGIPFLTTKIVGVIEGDSVPHEFLPLLIDHFENGYLPFDRLIRTFTFERIADAFEAMRTKAVVKPVLTFGA